MNRDKVRKMSARARDYIVAYYNLHYTEGKDKPPLYNRLELSDIERMRRTYRCHRSILDICGGECNKMAKDIQAVRLKANDEESGGCKPDTAL